MAPGKRPAASGRHVYFTKQSICHRSNKEMQTAQLGDLVTVIYEGIVENGEIFESSEDTGPLAFRIGSGNVLPGFEEAVIGMGINETREIVLPPEQAEQAYGRHDKNLLHTVSRSSWDAGVDIRPGVIVGMTMEKEGTRHQVPATITEVAGDKVTVDFNHPLAGKTIRYRITLRKIETPEPLRSAPGSPPAGCSCSS
jgi:peptidylprolyl isomerase